MDRRLVVGIGLAIILSLLGYWWVNRKPSPEENPKYLQEEAAWQAQKAAEQAAKPEQDGENITVEIEGVSEADGEYQMPLGKKSPTHLKIEPTSKDRKNGGRVLSTHISRVMENGTRFVIFSRADTIQFAGGKLSLDFEFEFPEGIDPSHQYELIMEDRDTVYFRKPVRLLSNASQ